MNKCNLVFGSMDFIVNKADEWVFIENNSMGQFLWLEEYCPELTILDAFSRFLVSSDPNFTYKKPSTENTIHFSDICKKLAREQSSKVGQKHLIAQSSNISIE